MEGSVLHFDRGSDQGFIRATDGKRYSFTFADWRSPGLPGFGDVVDFEPDDDRARAIFVLKSARGAVDLSPVVAPAAPVLQELPPPLPPAPSGAPVSSADWIDDEPEMLPLWRTTKGMLGLAGLGALLLFGLLWFNRYEWLGVERPGPELVGVTGEETSLFVVADANLRNKPTSKGSSVSGKVPRGTKVSGVMQMGEDGKSPWFKLADGRGYIGAVNLSKVEPPRLAKSFTNRDWTAATDLDLRTLPNASSLILEQVAAGAKLTLAGVTESGYAEVKLAKGGVGYFSAEGIDLESNAAPPVALSFNPSSCSFGPDLDALFKIEFDAEAKRERALETAAYPDEEAREQAQIDYDNKSTFTKVSRSANGLSISAIGVKNGSSSLYFANSSEQVLAAFRKLGFAIGSDGVFNNSEGPGVYIAGTSGEQLPYGKTLLFCGG